MRVGGSFVWPPRALYSQEGLKRAVFVAGGVGVNPLVSMLSFLAERKEKVGKEFGFDVTLLYSTRDPGLGLEEEVLFLERLAKGFHIFGNEGNFQLFLTAGKGETDAEQPVDNMLAIGAGNVLVKRRRIEEADLLDALGPAGERNATVCYICGVPSMTDELVEKAVNADGMLRGNVLFEKWW